jgi:hypothetical protein
MKLYHGHRRCLQLHSLAHISGCIYGHIWCNIVKVGGITTIPFFPLLSIWVPCCCTLFMTINYFILFWCFHMVFHHYLCQCQISFKLIHLSVRMYVEVLKPKSLLKLSPRTWGPKNYSRPQSHTFTSLLTESRVLSPNQSRSQVPTPRLQITYWDAYGQAER